MPRNDNIADDDKKDFMDEYNEEEDEDAEAGPTNPKALKAKGLHLEDEDHHDAELDTTEKDPFDEDTSETKDDDEIDIDDEVFGDKTEEW